MGLGLMIKLCCDIFCCICWSSCLGLLVTIHDEATFGVPLLYSKWSRLGGVLLDTDVYFWF